jgi:hypothetical protein
MHRVWGLGGDEIGGRGWQSEWVRWTDAEGYIIREGRMVRYILVKKA